MTKHFQELFRAPIFVATIGGSLSAVLGMTVIVGWHSSSVLLIQVLPTFVPMQYNTALGFLLCGTGLIATVIGRGLIGNILGGVAAIIGGLTLVEYVLGLDIGIDQLFMEHTVVVKTSHPGRMAPNTALCFILTGFSLIAAVDLLGKAKGWVRVATMGGLVFGLGTVAFFGYFTGLETAYGWGELTRMAIHTAAGFIVLGTGVVALAWAEDGFGDGVFPRWFPSTLGIGGVTLSVALWQALDVQETRILEKWPDAGHIADEFVLVFGLTMAVFMAIAARQTQYAYERATALRESEERLQLAVQNMPVMLDAFDALGNIIVWNHECERVTGYAAAEVIGNPRVLEMFYPDPTYRDRVVSTIRKVEGDFYDLEFEITCKDGTTRVVSWSNTSCRNPIVGWATWAIGVDITERKRAEHKIATSLREKEVLLREVHHRVKNNMQVVASLLQSQGRKTKNKQVLEAFEESRNRIGAMSMIHEALHQSPGLSNVDFDRYLRKLVGNLCQANEAMAGRIGWTVDVADVSLGIDQAVPFGLIINELISNTFKHAFPRDRRGEIRVALSSDDGGEISLEVSDDGIGLPEDLDIRNTDTLGFGLVVGLTERQLRGSIAVDRTAGTKFLIRFPPDNSGERD